MQAKPGDWLVISAHRVGDVERRGEILEVHGQGGAPPYLVRWPDGHQSMAHPGADARVERREGPPG
jgi:hypothetical protein